MAIRGQLRATFDCFELGDLLAADAGTAALEVMLRRLGRAQELWPVALLRSMRALLVGSFADHEVHLAEARRLTAATRDPNAHRVLRWHQLHAMQLREQHDELRAREPEIMELYSAFPMPSACALGLADIKARAGDVEGTRKALASAPQLEHGLRADIGIGPMIAQAAFVAGDAELARASYDALLPIAHRNSIWTMTGFVCYGPIARSLMLDAGALGRWDDARRYFEMALGNVQRLGARPHLARLWYEWGLIQRRRGDQAEAERALGLAMAEAEPQGLVGLVELIRAAGGAPRPAVGAPLRIELRQEGELWTVAGGGELCRLKDSRGVRMLAELVRQAGREVHVLELSGAGGPVDGGDAGELLDAEGRRRYQARLAELEEEAAEAESWNDQGRAARVAEEREALLAELKRATGLGGRTRRSAGAVERARVNVQRRIAETLKRIQDASPLLGRHLAGTVKTGTLCSYTPET
jgi:hypothetical protein